jgi:hypothetical protein
MTGRKAKGIHYAGLKLGLALILGLLVVPAYVVAPMLFAELDSVVAGLIAGKIFHVSNLAILVLLVSVMLFYYRIQVPKRTWYILIMLMLMLSINTFGVPGMMRMIKAEAGDISSLASDDPLRWAFAFWHGMGSLLQLASSLFTVVLLMQNHCPAAHGKVEEVET